MTKYIGGLALMLALALASEARFRDDDTKKTQKDIADLAEALEKGKDGKDAVAAIKKKTEDLNTIMHIYKPRGKGGLGVGPKAAGDGIEFKILNLGKRALSKVQLSKEEKDLIKMGYVNLAVGKITHAYAPTKAKGGKGAKEWKSYCDDQEKASKDLIEAVKKGEPAGIKTAASAINAACNNCHTDFRDN